MADNRRQRRRSNTGDAAATQPDPDRHAAADLGSATAGAGKPRRRGSADSERGLRGLVGSGPTQVGVQAAMRARDASRPTEEELAAADADVVIVRRNWQPPPD